MLRTANRHIVSGLAALTTRSYVRYPLLGCIYRTVYAVSLRSRDCKGLRLSHIRHHCSFERLHSHFHIFLHLHFEINPLDTLRI